MQRSNKCYDCVVLTIAAACSWRQDTRKSRFIYTCHVNQSARWSNYHQCWFIGMPYAVNVRFRRPIVRHCNQSSDNDVGVDMTSQAWLFGRTTEFRLLCNIAAAVIRYSIICLLSTMPSKCVHCQRTVHRNQHAVACDVCSQWVHRTCSTGMYIV